jgi:prevent-host-death family protein
MKNIKISNDIIPIGEFKVSISRYLKNVQQTGQPLIITQNGRPAGVLLSPAEYDELIYRKELFNSIERGLNDANSGNIYTTSELKEELSKRRSEREAQ